MAMPSGHGLGKTRFWCLPLVAWIASRTLLCYGWILQERGALKCLLGRKSSFVTVTRPVSFFLPATRNPRHSFMSEAALVSKNETLAFRPVTSSDVVNAGLLNRMEGATPVQVFGAMVRHESHHRTKVDRPESSACSIPNLRREKEPGEKMESVQRAIDQVDAILCLYNSTAGTLRISSDVVLSALESLLVTSCDQFTHEPSEHVVPKDYPRMELVERLEALVWKLGECNIRPSPIIVQSLWKLQQVCLAQGSERAPSSAKPSRLVGRRIRLLSEWLRCEIHVVDGGTSQPASRPADHFLEVLEYSLDQNVTMTFSMWDVYRSLHDNERHEAPTLSANAYATMLKLLETSSHEWKSRSCRVLQDMMQLARKCNDTTYAPTSPQLKCALQQSVRSGRIQDVAWLMRHLPNDDPDFNQQLVFLQALSRCREPGSTLYMELLLERWSSDLGMEGYKLLLKKVAASRTKQQGDRAREAFLWVQSKHLRSLESSDVNRQSKWKPDAQLVYLVVQAYLHEPGDSQLEQLLRADKFVRSSVNNGFLRQDSCSIRERLLKQRYPYRIFDKLLEAYSTKHYGDQGARDAANELFQYFLVQHRNGCVAEEPDSYHLGHVLRLWNRKTLGRIGVRKSLEYLHLYENLRNHGLSLSAKPDEFNIRQVLGTLARSDMQGLGDDALKLLDRVLVTDDVSCDGYARGHMFYCVIRCYCNDRTIASIVKAMETLDRMERLHERNPRSVQVTGAAYQTVLKALASILKTGSQTEPGAITMAAESATIAELARDIVRRIERQSECGNVRARLTRSIYLDAIRCCKFSPSHEHHCTSFREKLTTIRR